MNKEFLRLKIKKWIEEAYKGSYRFLREKNFKAQCNSEEYKLFTDSTNLIEGPTSLKVYCFINDIEQQPKCKICYNKVKFNTTKKEYNIYCSNECRYKDSEAITKKRRQTNIKRYGTSNILNSDSIIKKREKKLLETHGVDNYFKSEEYKANRQLGKYKSSDRIKQKKSRNRSTYKKLKDGLLGNVELITPLEEFEGVGYNKKYKWLCKQCNNQYTSWYMNGIIKNCPHCKQYTSIEDFVISILKDNNIEYQTNNRELLNGREIDIFIPEHNIGIETNGLFWHCDKVILDKNYHLNKLNIAIENNIKLINIFEDEIHNKPEIVKSRILSKLNIFENVIYARKCNIKFITSKEANIFYEQNHIQGRCNSSINIGLFYNEELVSALSFSKLRPALGHTNISDKYELTRFSNKLNTKIIGGFTKGISYLEKNTKITEVYSYCDRRWSEGEFYISCGFEFIKNTKPNYWYIPPNKIERQHRYNYRKHILKDKLKIYDCTLSEIKNMKNNKYNVIWDCGNKLFTKKIKK